MRQMCGDLISQFKIGDQYVKQWYLCGFLRKNRGIMKLQWKRRFYALTKDGYFVEFKTSKSVIDGAAPKN